MAQPTVARRIEALEHELGVVLFEKSTRGFRPTSAALALVPLAEAMEAAATAFCAKRDDLTALQPIRITAFNRNFSTRAMEIFDAYAEQHPDVSFEFLPGVRAFDLMAGEADIALRLSLEAPEPDLICRKISTAQFALYGSDRYADRFGLPGSVEDLHGHRFVTFDRPDITPFHHNWLTRKVTPCQIVQTYVDTDLLSAAIRSGRGLGVMNVRLAEADGGFLRCFDPIEELSAEHVLLVSPEAWRRPEIKGFVSFFAPRYAAIFR